LNRFEQIERLFEQGTALPPDGRAAFLDAHTAGDPALRAEVEELLRASASANANPAWEHGALSNATPAPHPAFDAPSGFAQYRILETIGVGGMGTVYRALRTGENMEQVVAIKILHAPASGAAAGYRFEQERRILARLDHPDIARLLDCGATPDGRPFLVMDYVHGVTITQYLGNTNLTIAQRTELFLAICAVVSYIHRNLVAHRDIKPGNILVTPEGTPKLLDFGIATLLDGSALRTLTGNAALTPEYASPEQVQGLPAGPASDIYSLGVVFYQMLTGHLPYNPQPGPLGLANAITQAPPVRPRTHVPSIPADLEYILLKALRKEPARRYESVEQLSADLQRFRKSFPVSARPDSFAYRLARALHRNRVWAAAATLVIAAIIAGSAIAIRQSNRRFAEIRKIAEVLTRELDDSIYDIGGTAQARRLILQRGAEYLNAIAGERGNDRAVALDLADAYQRFATLQGVNQLNVGSVPNPPSPRSPPATPKTSKSAAASPRSNRN
jgi:serine/threonine protein kinase